MVLVTAQMSAEKVRHTGTFKSSCLTGYVCHHGDTDTDGVDGTVAVEAAISTADGCVVLGPATRCASILILIWHEDELDFLFAFDLVS